MYYLGINYYGHNTSCALVKDGKLIYAAEEERFSRKKNDGSIPIKSIKNCLKFNKIKIDDISEIYAATVPQRLIREKYLKYSLNTFPDSSDLLLEKKSFNIMNFLVNAEHILKKKLNYKKKIKFINHHYCHLASAHFLSGFKDSCCVSIDGLGEIESIAIGEGKGNKIKLSKSVNFPNSLGMFYSAITHYLGFKAMSSEGTVMALATFGNYNQRIPNKKISYYKKLKSFIKIENNLDLRIDLSWFNFPFTRKGWVSKKFIDFFGEPRKKNSKITKHHKNIASALQKVFEEIYINIIIQASKVSKSKNLTLSGGCALNCKANGLILSKTNFKDIYIQPASHDAGLAVGAAYLGYLSKHKNNKNNFERFDHTYFGPNFSSKQIENTLKKLNLKFNKLEDSSADCAQKLKDGSVIGWFQGKMEFGPRALGNRSILSAPYPIGKKDYINKKIKHREDFRPFAPAILEEMKSDYYKINVRSPFMLIATFLKNKNKKNKIAATLHNDSSARVQTVTEKNNKKFYRLISNFFKIAGIPVVLNTSFNDKGEPMVCSHIDAIKSFYKTNLNYLYLDNYLIKNTKYNLNKIKSFYNL